MTCVLLGVTGLFQDTEQLMPNLACARPGAAAAVVGAADMPKETKFGKSCCRASTDEKISLAIKEYAGERSCQKSRNQRGKKQVRSDLLLLPLPKLAVSEFLLWKDLKK